MDQSTISESVTAKTNPKEPVQFIAQAIRELPASEREAYVRALSRDGVLATVPLGALCGPASHNF